LENEGFTLKTHQMFSVHTKPERNLKTQQSPVISVDLGLRETLAEENYDYRNIVHEKLRFQNIFRPH